MTWINFQEVKTQGDFMAVLAHFDITGKQNGDEVRINCPFHDDKNPSCGVNIAENKFNCFSCQEHGNILDFATLLNGGDPQDPKDLRNGAKLVMDICGISTPRKQKATRKPRTQAKKPKPKAESKKNDSVDSEGVCNKPLAFQLKLEPEHEFFDHQGICPEQVEQFGLGYASRGSMNERIAIPIHNETGELVAYAGRWASDEIPEDTDKYKFPNGFKKSLVLYNLNRIIEAKPKHIVLVEGFWSAQRLHRLNIPVVAVMGTSICPEQVALLKQFGVKFVTVIFDGDEAGRNGAKSVVLELANNIYARSIDLPDGIKPDVMGDDFLSKITNSRG